MHLVFMMGFLKSSVPERRFPVPPEYDPFFCFEHVN
jgi:hypothetical protein